MRKKVLMIVGTMQSGGVSKSMINLLNAWDCVQYDTTLLLCCKSGDVFSKYIPSGVRVVYNPVIESVMRGWRGMRMIAAEANLSFLKKLYLIAGIGLRLILSKFSKPMAARLIAKMMPVVSKEEYDLIVDYGGQQLLYYMVDKLRGKYKVSFFHSDYAKWPYYYAADRKYYPQVDAIFTISPQCVLSLKRYFPECTEKIHLMENISTPSIIQRLSADSVIIPKHRFTLATLGHVWYNKGIDLAIEAADILNKKGIDFLWIFIGAVKEPKWVEEVGYRGLADAFLFTGIQSNPYPYLAKVDIYVHPSRFEGKSIAIDEAKIMCKPIVATNFSTVADQLTDGINASICEMRGSALAEKIECLFNNSTLCRRYSDELHNHIIDNSTEVKKLYAFL